MKKKFIASKKCPGSLPGEFVPGFIINYLTEGGWRGPILQFLCYMYSGPRTSQLQITVSRERQQKAGFHTNPAIADFAVRRIDGTYTGNALTLDYHTSNDLISGLLGVTIGTKDGMRDAFYGPLVAMTDSMWHSFTDGMDVSDQFRDQVRGDFGRYYLLNKGTSCDKQKQ